MNLNPCYSRRIVLAVASTFLRTSARSRRARRAGGDRRIRERNKVSYRLDHWPIWIFVFFIAPGPLTFDLFARGFDTRMALWLGVVLVGTGIAGLRGRLPGVEPTPYIIRFTEDRPNPLYRRVCYTFAWSEVITFAVLNIAGLVDGDRHRRVAAAADLRRRRTFRSAGTIWLLGALGRLPRVKPSTKGEGHERRYFYGSVWAVCVAQPVLWLLWKVAAADAAVRRRSSWPSSSGSSRSSATSRAAAACRARGRSFPGEIAVSDYAHPDFAPRSPAMGRSSRARLAAYQAMRHMPSSTSRAVIVVM